MLREELQSSREGVLAQITAEITTSFKEIKNDIVSLREETKADASELAQLHSAHAETANKCGEMGAALGDTMDRVPTMEQSQQLINKKYKKLQDRYQNLENRSRRQNLLISN